MKILIGQQIKEADRYTIENEPVESIELMERAAEVVAQSICNRVEQGSDLLFFIGKGNNGGDGLAVARMLANVGFNCSVYLVYPQDVMSENASFNLDRLPESVRLVNNQQLEITEDTVIIDAIIGSGMKGVIDEEVLAVVKMINQLQCLTIAIDIPTGMKTEFDNDPDCIVHANMTLTLEFPKLAMMLPEAGECCGEIEVLAVDLHQDYITEAPSKFHYIDSLLVSSFLKKLTKFSHKGECGHALLVCGSETMGGAAILAVNAALRSGCGVVTSHLPRSIVAPMFASAPAAVVSMDSNSDAFSTLPQNLDKYDAVGVGCGIGQHPATASALEALFKEYKGKMVIDADAINIIASNPEFLSLIPENAILTPHVGEFQRLVGNWGSEEEKIELMRDFANTNKCVIILKGAHTAVCLDDGRIFFNSSGCSGMAKGGCGDVLTGILTGLLARGYNHKQASILGIHLHGWAGEKAGEYYTNEAMNSSDLIDFIADAWKEIR